MSHPNHQTETAKSVLLPTRTDRRWGYVDVDGHVVVKPTYDSTGECFEGQPYASDGEKLVFFSSTGELLATLEDGWAMQSFRRGLLAFERDLKTGFCNSEGRVVIDPRFSNATPFIAEGISVRDLVNGQCCAYRVTADGERFNDFNYEIIRPFLYGERLTGGKLLDIDAYVVIDGFGQPIGDQRYADVRCGADGLLPIRYIDGSNKMGWVDENLSVVVPGRFDDLGDYFCGGIIPACQSGLWGLVRRDGQWVVKPKFSFVGNGGNGVWPVAVAEPFEGDLGKPASPAMTLCNREGELLTNERFAKVVMYNESIAQCYWPRGSNATARDPVPFGYLNIEGEVIWSEK